MSSSSPSPGAQINQKIDTLNSHLPHVPESKAELKQEAEVAVQKSFAGLRSLAAGGFWWFRLQTAERGVYKGAIDVVTKSVAKDGLVRGLYAGVSAPLVGVTPMFAVSFWGFDVGKNLVRNFTSTAPHEPLSIAQISTAGFFSAIPQTLITAPFERVKVLLQIQGQKELAPGEEPKYNGGVDVVKQLYKEGEMALEALPIFATYEYIKRRLTPIDPATGKPGKDLSLLAITGAGACAGVAMWIPVFPVDTVKSRLQTMEGKPTVGGVIKGLYRNGGLKAFFPGFGPALARAVPANAATFLGVELAHQGMNKVFG
ncbi:hypothetical protein DID88_007769 [Monilinia fructigena]|uniref:Mitochondrial carrier n=1 Tax=Monilinia fructigena TaxID=38457 RepID=A0A395J8F3_9HELO|nr:hypothetical protein DID88_007769 [Monilinia fructigena]